MFFLFFFQVHFASPLIANFGSEIFRIIGASRIFFVSARPLVVQIEIVKRGGGRQAKW